jgi:hypothetical protein
MCSDPVVSEVRRVREAHAAKCNFDLDAIFADLKANERASGRKYVRHPPRPVSSTQESASSQQRRTSEPQGVRPPRPSN